MYPSGSDCSSYTDQGRDSAPNCEQCPSTGPTWAGLDVVSSTLPRAGWDDRGFGQPHVHSSSFIESCDPSRHGQLHGCQACTDPRIPDRLPSPTDWGPREILDGSWPPQHWSPCCLPDASCAQHCTDLTTPGVGQHSLESTCCEPSKLHHSPGTARFDTRHAYPPDFQVCIRQDFNRFYKPKLKIL